MDKPTKTRTIIGIIVLIFANTAADETLIPGAVPPPAEEKADNAEDEDDGEFKEEHPEITAGDEETLIEE